MSREHVIEHEPGQGQKAFAPMRRDMTQHRLETEKRRSEKAKEREERQAERQRLAAEAAEDLIQEVEAIDGDEEDKPTGAAAAGVESEDPSESMKIDESQAQRPAEAPPSLSTSHKRHTAPTSARPKLGISGDEGVRSLSARLPPQLAALRVAMPGRPFGHDVKNAIDGSAIADDEPTPISEEPPLLPSSACTSYFTEPLSWMRPQLEYGDMSGKLVCPNTRCNAKLGTFDWSGREYSFHRSKGEKTGTELSLYTVRCSCAAWISPGFALNASKVDEIRM